MAHDHSHSHEHGDATVVALGVVELGSSKFAVDREGECMAGVACTFGVELLEGDATPVEAWLVTTDGEVCSDVAAGEGHDDHWHFAVTAENFSRPAAFVVSVSTMIPALCGAMLGTTSTPLGLSSGRKPQHGGILAAGLTKDGADSGFVELKLHDDMGDLELWLTGADGKALDVAADTSVTLAFPSHEGKTAKLAVRNKDKNEDEDGVANMRDGKTNYFIFPGESGQDPEWLKGLKWRGVVQVSFGVQGGLYACAPFVLVPHSVL